MKRNALGKGLSALLPDPDPQPGGTGETTDRGGILEVPVESLEPNPLQPRTHFAAAALEELADSIRESGLVQPILVRRTAGGRHQIIAGERRWRAAKQLGLTTVPVMVREVPDDRLLEMALVENIQREELSPLEEAHAYQNLIEALRLTQEELAKKLGKDRSTVANSVRLLRLPAEVQALINDRRLDAGHARPLLALEHADDQIALAREAVQKALSAREVERRVALQRASGASAKGAPGDRKDANTKAAEERLRASLGTRVEIRRRARGGILEIAFANEAELNRLFEWLVRSGRGRG
jgi:ParB family transcriptional regulator, chromosome partitioning protein